MLIYWFYIAILFFTNGLAIKFWSILVKNKNNISALIYVLAGLISESLFYLINSHTKSTLTAAYDVLFPALIFISVLIRLPVKFNKFGLLISILWVLGLIYLDQYDFSAMNYLVSISGLLFLVVYSAQKTSLKLTNIIDVAMAIGLSFMLMTMIMANKVMVWKVSSMTLVFNHLFGYILIFILILINVKFWRHTTY